MSQLPSLQLTKDFGYAPGQPDSIFEALEAADVTWHWHTPRVFAEAADDQSSEIGWASATPESSMRHYVRHALGAFSYAPKVTEATAQPLEEQLFDSLINLKIAVSQYAMHLPSGERGRLYCALDDLLDVEAWHEGDKLPEIESFRNFLKWQIYAHEFAWTSLGLSDAGEILVGWRRPNLVATARFGTDGKVRWTSRLESPNGLEQAAGICSMQHFSQVSRNWQRASQ